MGPLRHVHISRPMLVALACVSALATAVILHTGSRRTPAQTAALAALAAGTRTVSAPASTPASAPPTTHRAGHTATHGGGAPSTGSSGGSPAPAIGVGSGADGAGSPTPASTAPVTSSTPTTPAHHSDLPNVDHVFMVVLSTPSYRAAFGAHSRAPYLRSLVHRGTLLTHFESLGRGELADELALVSGQAPNRDTSRGCPTYRDFPASASVNRAGDATGVGCVYPDSALTIGDQVTSDGHTWDAYIADMGETPCAHPDSDAPTDEAIAGTEAGYDLDHNPFVFFDSLLDAGGCQGGDDDLTALPHALAKPSRTPRLAYIAPDACADGDPVSAPASTTTTTTATTTTTTTTSTGPPTTAATTTTPTTAAVTTTPTASAATTTPTTTTPTTTTPTTPGSAATPAAVGCPAGQPSGIAAENAFLRQWVPKVLHSGAYRSHGVLVIAFAGTASASHPVRTGALVISRDTRRDARIATAATPYSLLRSIEGMLGDSPLAHAAGTSSLAARLLAAG